MSERNLHKKWDNAINLSLKLTMQILSIRLPAFFVFVLFLFLFIFLHLHLI